MPACVVVADTGPLHYLVLIDRADVLPQLFGAIAVPATVAGELRHPNAPDAVRAWAASPPSWLAVHDDPSAPASLQRVDPGERAAIALAQVLGAGLLLVDDRVGAAAARAAGFRVTGTIGVLIDAAGRRLLDLAVAFAALRTTNFRYPTDLLDALLEEHRPKPDGKPSAGA